MAARSLRSRAFFIGAVGALIVAQGCVDDGVSLHAICSIVPDVDNGICTYDAGGNSCISEGVLNLDATSFYTMSLRMESGLRARARAIPPQGEPNGLVIQSARVELRSANGVPILFAPPDAPPNPFTSTSAGYIAPGGLGAVTVNVLTPEHVAYLRAARPEVQQVVAAITVKGKTHGQQVVESSEFVWPIRFVRRNPSSAARECQENDGSACNVGQDLYAGFCTN